MQSDRSWTEIDLSNFKYNLKQISQYLDGNKKIMQIVKADAYGHGAYQIAMAAQSEGVSFLGVANADEGMMLRYQGIEIPILILSPSLDSEIETILDYNLIPSISDITFAKLLSESALHKKKIVTVQLILDTGMGRNGISINDFDKVYHGISSLQNLEIEGIFSHFSSSESDYQYSELQLKLFKDEINKLERKPKYLHISNSSGIIAQLEEEFTNMVRVGLLSYGVYSHPDLKSKIDLKPVMTFKTRISMLKRSKKGDYIGYNKTFQSTGDIDYAILPIGYADGYDFKLSNCGIVSIDNVLCPVIGKVSMDMIAVDVSLLHEPVIGAEVTLLGGTTKQLRTENIAELYNGSSYELLCQIGRRAKRYYCNNGKIVDSSPLLRRDFVSSDYNSKELNTVIGAAVEQRLQSKEIADLVYNDILNQLFSDSDKNINYRYDFSHSIEFLSPNETEPDFYQVNTLLRFKKKISREYFIVACANSEKLLEKYFKQPDVEYRWLLYSDQALITQYFELTSVKVNDLELNCSSTSNQGYLEIKCSHPELLKFIGKDVEYVIKTKTFYPKDSHQLSIYISEMTKGINIEFIHNKIFPKIEVTPILSGKTRFPHITREEKSIKVETEKNQWVIPNSGIVFSY